MSSILMTLSLPAFILSMALHNLQGDVLRTMEAMPDPPATLHSEGPCLVKLGLAWWDDTWN